MIDIMDEWALEGSKLNGIFFANNSWKLKTWA